MFGVSHPDSKLLSPVRLFPIPSVSVIVAFRRGSRERVAVSWDGWERAMSAGQLTDERIDELKQRALAKVDEIASQLIEISDWMYENPELGLQERGAVERLTAHAGT